jgi:formylglycine-generating enzyme required for sulfatase activity
MKTLLLCSITLFAALSAMAQSRFPADFVLVKGGTFTMGSPISELDRLTDEIQHRVTIGDFYIAKSEVTQREYSELMTPDAIASSESIPIGNSPQGLMRNNPSNAKGDTLPVENITWFEAIRYCNARSAQEGLSPAYTISGETVTWNHNAQAGTAGYRLPTEAEWEYACRAGTTSAFNTGNQITDGQANFNNSYGYNTDASGRVIGV